MRGTRWILLLVATLVATASCGDSEAESKDDVVATAASVAGRTLVVTEIREDDAPRPAVAGSEIRFHFDDDRVSITAGCNAMSGAFEQDGATLRVGGLASTEVGCPDELMAQDAWLADLLSEPLEVGETSLTAGATVLTVADREDVSPDLDLTGTQWRLESLIDEQSISSADPKSAATLSYDGSRLSVHTGCNTGAAEATLEGDVLDVGPLAVTKKACADERAQQVEQAMLRVLDGEVTVVIEERRLTLTDDASGVGLGFVAAPASR